MNPLLRKAIIGGVAGGAALAGRRAAELGWRLTRDEPPPTAGDVHDDLELRDLLLWAMVVATTVAIARKLATDRAEELLGDD